MSFMSRRPFPLRSPPCLQLSLLLILAACGVLAVASSSGPGGKKKAPSSGPFRPEQAEELKNPALVLINTTDCPVALLLEGRTKRKLFMAPQTTLRTLLAAGVYEYRLAETNDDECMLGVDRTGRVRFAPKKRYGLRLGTPPE
jgi:hypothetical protein